MTTPADDLDFPNKAPLQHCQRSDVHPAHQHTVYDRAHYCPGTTPYGPYDPIWARLSDIGQLRPGWLNGEGKAISGNTILQAGRLAEALPANLRPLSIYPTEPGGIEIEWRDQHGTHSIEVQPDSTLFLLSDDPATVPAGGEQPHA